MCRKISQLFQEYQFQLSRQRFHPETLDYQILDTHRAFLQSLEQYTSSCISLFDCYQRRHISISQKFDILLGWNMDDARNTKGTSYMDDRIHPDDFEQLLETGTFFFRFLMDCPIEERRHYKASSSYRTLDARGQYIRVTEQSSPLELDHRGNIWLVLSMLDISSGKDNSAGFDFCVVNTQTGVTVGKTPSTKNQPTEKLTNREREILQLIAQGLISRQIAQRLFLSEKTVNTHRQRIIAKFKATNSSEAVSYALQMGYI
jgi:DNA-binding CsgD family transcriptional regulator